MEDYKKKYEDAFKKAKDLHDNHALGMPFIYETCEQIFPELKESEDEKIRKDIIWCIKYSGIKENNPINPHVTTTVKDAIAWLEKQGEQKPTDKVESKFKVGNWITDGTSVFQIVKIEGEWYIADDGDKVCFGVVNQYYHIWTIQDAKDGDVLVCSWQRNGKNIEQAGIFKEYIGRHGGCSKSFKIYAGIDWDKHLLIDDTMGSSEICPATKEQRILLFSKMGESGYTWDAEKKELRKIEQKPELPNGEDYGIDGLYHAASILEKTLGEVDGYQSDDGILEHKCAIEAVKRLYEQKPAWSEEDEGMLQTVINRLELSKTRNTSEIPYVERCVDWLKSLKERYTKISKEDVSKI